MRPVLISLLLLASAGLAGCGGASSSTTPTGPIAISKEQAEAIAKQDAQVEEEEGGAFIAKQRAKSKK